MSSALAGTTIVLAPSVGPQDFLFITLFLSCLIDMWLIVYDKLFVDYRLRCSFHVVDCISSWWRNSQI